MMVVKLDLIAEELGRAPFLAVEWARSMLGAVRQDAYRVAAISERFGASRPGPQQWPSCRTRRPSPPLVFGLSKGFGVLAFLPSVICPLALLAESYDT